VRDFAVTKLVLSFLTVALSGLMEEQINPDQSISLTSRRDRTLLFFRLFRQDGPLFSPSLLQCPFMVLSRLPLLMVASFRDRGAMVFVLFVVLGMNFFFPFLVSPFLLTPTEED